LLVRELNIVSPGGLELVYILLIDFLALQAAFVLFIMIDEGIGAAIVCFLIGCCLGPTTSVSLYLAARELAMYLSLSSCIPSLL